ncbi:unnamed protein product [Boreogadus saida]
MGCFLGVSSTPQSPLILLHNARMPCCFLSQQGCESATAHIHTLGNSSSGASDASERKSPGSVRLLGMGAVQGEAHRYMLSCGGLWTQQAS